MKKTISRVSSVGKSGGWDSHRQTSINKTDHQKDPIVAQQSSTEHWPLSYCFAECLNGLDLLGCLTIEAEN